MSKLPADPCGPSPPKGIPLVKPEHLHNAPIVEAIIDVSVSLPEGFECESLKGAHDELRADFPVLRKRKSVTRRIEFGDDTQPDAEVEVAKLSGYFFLTEDEKTICQFREDGFTFNKLNPYSSWESIYPAAKHAWSIYSRIACPQSILRIAVRYINKFDVAVPIDFSDIFTAPPRVDDQLPQEFLEFFSRIVIADRPSRAATIIQTIELSPKPNHATIVLDIDAFAVQEVTESNFDDTFMSLRNFKNSIFFKSLTPDTLEKFK